MSLIKVCILKVAGKNRADQGMYTKGRGKDRADQGMYTKGRGKGQS